MNQFEHHFLAASFFGEGNALTSSAAVRTVTRVASGVVALAVLGLAAIVATAEPTPVPTDRARSSGGTPAHLVETADARAAAL